MHSGKPEQFVKKAHDLIIRLPLVPNQQIEEEASVGWIGHCTSISQVDVVVAMPNDSSEQMSTSGLSGLAQQATGCHTAVMDAGPGKVVLDTNVFVADGFNPGSHSARLVAAVRDGRLRMVWNDTTRAEVEHVMRQIPGLSWERIADLFRSEDRFAGATNPRQFRFVPDPADRKFAALADAVKAPLITSDAGLLHAGGLMRVPVLKPSEFAISRSS
jgi:uncharacterized protein